MTILEQLAHHARERVMQAKERVPMAEITNSAQQLPVGAFSFEQALRKLGMHDASLDDLVASVRALLGESPTPGLA